MGKTKRFSADFKRGKWPKKKSRGFKKNIDSGKYGESSSFERFYNKKKK